VACAPPAHADAKCDGACDFTCQNGYERSGSACVDATKHDTWATVASLTEAIGAVVAAVGTDGRIFAIGETKTFGQSTQVYTPGTNTWAGFAKMPTVQRPPGAAAGLDGRVFAVGGNGPVGTVPGPVSVGTVDAYTPSTNSWATVKSLPDGRTDLAVVTATDGRIFAIGGETNYLSSSMVYTEGPSLADVTAYTPGTDTWAKVADMPTARDSLAAARGSDGRIYAIGGRAPSCSTCQLSYVRTVEVYTPSTDTWAAVAKMPTPRAYLAVAAGKDGRIYAMGGLGQSGNTVATVEAYTPSTDTWAKVADMPTARSSFAAVTGNDGRIYAIGGLQNGSEVTTVEVYTP
jgi:N-acetylneuraminic acid mutarotase